LPAPEGAERIKSSPLAIRMSALSLDVLHLFAELLAE